MSIIIPIRARGVRSEELAAALAELPAALPGAGAQLVEGKSASMLDPTTLALLIDAAAPAVAGVVGAIATIWAARIAARKPAAPAAPAAQAAPQPIIIIVETNYTAVRVTVDPADPAGSVAAAPLPATLDEVTGIRLGE